MLATGLAVAGAVNVARWGDPLTFADYRYHNFNAMFPDRVVRTATYGLFNLRRIPFGLVYCLALLIGCVSLDFLIASADGA